MLDIPPEGDLSAQQSPHEHHKLDQANTREKPGFRTQQAMHLDSRILMPACWAASQTL